MKIDKDGFRFDFRHALSVLDFDQRGSSICSRTHQPMKAVDIVAEFEGEDIFVEIKDIEKHRSRPKLINSLKLKYRDSYLFRHAEIKIKKPIRYICLISGFDNGAISSIQDTLYRQLPVGKAFVQWKRSIVDDCQVVNFDQWNTNFRQWPVIRI